MTIISCCCLSTHHDPSIYHPSTAFVCNSIQYHTSNYRIHLITYLQVSVCLSVYPSVQITEIYRNMIYIKKKNQISSRISAPHSPFESHPLGKRKLRTMVKLSWTLLQHILNMSGTQNIAWKSTKQGLCVCVCVCVWEANVGTGIFCTF